MDKLGGQLFFFTSSSSSSLHLLLLLYIGLSQFLFPEPEKINTDDCSFRVIGLKLQGAQCRNNELLLTSTILMDLPVTLVRWVRIESQPSGDKLSLPVYLNSTRTELLFNVELNITAGQDPHSFYQRGVALLTSTSLNWAHWTLWKNVYKGPRRRLSMMINPMCDVVTTI